MKNVLFRAEAITIDELDAIARKIIGLFSTARVFALYGEMGVGKTTFVKYLCSKLGVVDVVNSPTFSIVNDYERADSGRIFHFDFYRIKKLEEVFDMGYEEYFYSGQYCFIEWPEKIETLLPENSIRIYMEERAGTRIISV
jgi:tRNA threonylcarbamoyladenosine biosynthesis protein TsaE